MVARLLIVMLLGLILLEISGIKGTMQGTGDVEECERFGRMLQTPVFSDQGRCYAVVEGQAVPTEEIIQRLRNQSSRPKVVM